MTIAFGSEEAQGIVRNDKRLAQIQSELPKRVTCPRCNGWGDEQGFWAEEDEQINCFLCDGFGWVWREEAERLEFKELHQAELARLARWQGGQP